MKIPPPIIDSCKLLYFAENDDEVKFTGRISLFVGDVNEGLEPIGEKPRLVITHTYCEPREYLLMFCDIHWSVKGVISFTTIDEAKIKAERVYNKITQKWKESPYSNEEINNFLRDEYEVDPHSDWWECICSFCAKKDSELEEVLVGEYASICKSCVINFYNEFNENA